MKKKSKLTVFEDGSKMWHLNNVLHREDGPAKENPDGGFEWYCNGLIHREGGPAIRDPDGSEYWFRDGLFHRENGPAVDTPTLKYWYVNGVPHRVSGPAVESKDKTVSEWFLWGSKISSEWVNENTVDPFNITHDEQVLMQLRWI